MHSEVDNDFSIDLKVYGISSVAQEHDFKLLQDTITDGPETFWYFKQNTFQRGDICVLDHGLDKLMAL